MADRNIHPNPDVNRRRFAAQERKASEMGYVVKWHGNRKYFDSYRDATQFRDELIHNGWYKEDIQIINIARQRDSETKVKRQLAHRVGGRSFYGAGLTANELALMVLGRMCEATSHTFRCNYPTMEMRKAAQRALRNKMRKGEGYDSETVRQALALKLHVIDERK
jgi:hypothetical protein